MLSYEMELFNLRKDINDIDNKLMELLISRLEVVEKVGELKKKHNMEVLDKKRENVIFKKIETLYGKETDETKFLTQIYNKVMEESKKKQEELIKLE
tara:strand:- start:270 stop:560 length:291 start_codon:yes stop_codon:yes gene_type:complete